MCEFTPKAIRDCLSVELQKYLQDKPENFLFNELALQMFVARTLEKVFSSEEFKVHLEYSLPIDWNKTFKDGYDSWETETPYIDIVLEKKALIDGGSPEFVAIELKYKLKEAALPKDTSFLRFGEAPNSESNSEIVLVNHQGAQDEGRYDFWKDVKRVELLTEAFPNIIGGFSLFLTNDPSYLEDNKHCKYSKFSFTSEKEAGLLFWNNNSSRCKAQPLCMQDDEQYFAVKYPKEKNLLLESIKMTCLTCGKYKCCDYCGEKFKKGKSTIERPNFYLKNSYKGEWFPNEKGFSDGLKQQLYCYSVVVPKWQNR